MNALPYVPGDRVHTSPLARRNAVLRLLRGARRHIDLSVFRCDSPDILAALADASARGVRVNALLTPSARAPRASLEALGRTLATIGAFVQVYRGPLEKYHAKYIVVDDGPALIATFNLTEKCLSRTCDACLVTYDRAVVEGLRALLAADRAGCPLPAGLASRLIVAPERSRTGFASLIDKARTSVRIIDPKLDDPDVLQLLRRRIAEGIRVEVHRVRRLGAMKSHGKLMLIDDRIAVLGSMALAPASLDRRRELAVTVDAPSAVAEVARLFDSVSRAAGGSATRADRSRASRETLRPVDEHKTVSLG